MHFAIEIGKSHQRIYNEDCVAGMSRHLDPCSVDVVVTSPPYNLGTSYSGYDDTIPREQYLDWLENWAHKVHHFQQLAQFLITCSWECPGMVTEL